MTHSEETRRLMSEATRRHWAENPRPRMSATERLARRTEERDGHHLWTGTISNRGYGTLRFDGRTQYAHRLAYETFVGPIPEGMWIDHLCRVRACVNPEHLEPVTAQVNVLRGIAPSAIAARTGFCQRGHEFTPENTYVRRDGKRRMCRECCRLRSSKAWRDAG